LLFLFYNNWLFISQSQLIRSYGIKAGVASTNWDWTAQERDLVANPTAHQSLDAGIFVEWLDIPFLSVVTEIYYIKKGADATTNYTWVIVSGEVVFLQL